MKVFSLRFGLLVAVISLASQVSGSQVDEICAIWYENGGSSGNGGNSVGTTEGYTDLTTCSTESSPEDPFYIGQKNYTICLDTNDARKGDNATCFGYWECEGSVGIYNICPFNEFYNVRTQTCDVAAITHCHYDRCLNRDAKYASLPNNFCRNYIDCDTRQRYLCPEEKRIFNPVTEVCQSAYTDYHACLYYP